MIAAIFVTVALAGCFAFAAHDEKVDGPYRLVATDTMDDMMLCWSDGSDICEGIVQDKVIAAGANERFVVAAREVNLEPFGKPPRYARNLEYYYMVRTRDEAVHSPQGKNLIGPLTKSQFAQAKRQLNLPDFSREFEKLD
jgi:hypothetical protein